MFTVAWSRRRRKQRGNIQKLRVKVKVQVTWPPSEYNTPSAGWFENYLFEVSVLPGWTTRLGYTVYYKCFDLIILFYEFALFNMDIYSELIIIFLIKKNLDKYIYITSILNLYLDIR